MIWKEFAEKAKKAIKENERISLLHFNWDGKEYQVVSQWGSGDNRENVNLWAKRVGDKSNQVHPFVDDVVDKLEFFRGGDKK